MSAKIMRRLSTADKLREAGDEFLRLLNSTWETPLRSRYAELHIQTRNLEAQFRALEAKGEN